VADPTQIKAVNRAIEEWGARIADARAGYGEIPAVRRLANDVDRLTIDASELADLPAVRSEALPSKIAISGAHR
jgi:hypothetical protein